MATEDKLLGLSVLQNSVNYPICSIILNNEEGATWVKNGVCDSQGETSSIEISINTEDLSSDNLFNEDPQGERKVEVGNIIVTYDIELLHKTERFPITAFILATLLVFFTIFLVDRLTKSISKPLIQLSKITKFEEIISRKTPITIDDSSEIGDLYQAIDLLRIKAVQNEELQECSLNEQRKLREKADKANFAKTCLLKLISHEMNQPLASAFSLLEVLIKKNKSETTGIYLETIKRNVKQNVRFIEDLIQLSDIDNPQNLGLTYGKTDVIKVFESACIPIGIEAKHKGISFTSLSSTDEIFLFTDEYRLLQIFSNLLSNAVKYTDHGHIEARLSIFVINDHALIEFSVQDSGVGINQADQQRIFQMFERLDMSDARKTQGKGIGLFVVQQIVTAMNGNISLTSEPDKGSCFTVRFEAELFHEEKDQLKLQDNSSDFGGLLVMVVDDYSDTNMAFKAILEQLDASVILCSSGEEAIARFKEHRPNVILMDCQLPGLTGMEIAEKIRNIESEHSRYFDQSPPALIDNRTIIVGCSAAGHPMKEPCFDSGMNGFIKKPFTIQDLTSTINNLRKAQQIMGKKF